MYCRMRPIRPHDLLQDLQAEFQSRSRLHAAAGARCYAEQIMGENEIEMILGRVAMAAYGPVLEFDQAVDEPLPVSRITKDGSVRFPHAVCLAFMS